MTIGASAPCYHAVRTLDTITTTLIFEGNAEEAITFYTSLFDDGEVRTIIRAEADEGGWAPGTCQQAVFSLAGQQFIGINKPPPGAPSAGYVPWHQFSFTPAMAIYVKCETEDEIDRLYAELSENGQVLMPLRSYGWSTKFGWVNDRFGVSWRLNLPLEAGGQQ